MLARMLLVTLFLFCTSAFGNEDFDWNKIERDIEDYQGRTILISNVNDRNLYTIYLDFLNKNPSRSRIRIMGEKPSSLSYNFPFSSTICIESECFYTSNWTRGVALYKLSSGSIINSPVFDENFYTQILYSFDGDVTEDFDHEVDLNLKAWKGKTLIGRTLKDKDIWFAHLYENNRAEFAFGSGKNFEANYRITDSMICFEFENGSKNCKVPTKRSSGRLDWVSDEDGGYVSEILTVVKFRNDGPSTNISASQEKILDAKEDFSELDNFRLSEYLVYDDSKNSKSLNRSKQKVEFVNECEILITKTTEPSDYPDAHSFVAKRINFGGNGVLGIKVREEKIGGSIRLLVLDLKFDIDVKIISISGKKEISKFDNSAIDWNIAESKPVISFILDESEKNRDPISADFSRIQRKCNQSKFSEKVYNRNSFKIVQFFDRNTERLSRVMYLQNDIQKFVHKGYSDGDFLGNIEFGENFFDALLCKNGLDFRPFMPEKFRSFAKESNFERIHLNTNSGKSMSKFDGYRKIKDLKIHFLLAKSASLNDADRQEFIDLLPNMGPSHKKKFLDFLIDERFNLTRLDCESQPLFVIQK